MGNLWSRKTAAIAVAVVCVVGGWRAAGPGGSAALHPPAAAITGGGDCPDIGGCGLNHDQVLL